MDPSKRRIIGGVILLIVIGGAGFIINNMRADLAYADSDAKASSVDKSLVAANTDFAVRLLLELQREQSGENIFISPISVSIALSMTYNGADSATKEAMSAALGLDGMRVEEVNLGYQQLILSLLSVDKDVSLNIGDSVWIRSSFADAVKQEFKDAMSKYYLSDVYSRPFEDSTVREVNSWVDKETRGKISKILDSIDSEMVMFIINAIYFKGGWVDEFDEASTKSSDFTTAEGSVIKVDMMNREGTYSYYSDEGVEVVRLPYGRDKVAMYVFLPAEDGSLESYAASLTGAKLDAYFGKLSERELILAMPKFKLEYGKVDLKDALTSLGMGVAFDPNAANFNGIADVAPERLYIAFVDHKAVIEVNEKGTEAAAVTNVGIGLTSAPMSTLFVVDRPYMFVIRDDRSGSILFSGFIYDPTVQESP